jgi:hypothetical protein
MALLCAVTAGVAVSASASNLSVATGGVGSGVAKVVACQAEALTVASAVTYTSSIPGYQVAEVTVTGLDAVSGSDCTSKMYRIALTGDSGVSLGEITGTTPASTSSFVVDFSSVHVKAADVTEIHISITG